MQLELSPDWGESSEPFDELKRHIQGRRLTSASEAQTRHNVIDKMIHDVLGWEHGQVTVEERIEGDDTEYADYVLRSGDNIIVVEAKKKGASFPAPTRMRTLKLHGSVLGSGEIATAIAQARGYALSKEAAWALVTNGTCWCAFQVLDPEPPNIRGILYFPFTDDDGAERLHQNFSCSAVEAGSLRFMGEEPQSAPDNRLLSQVKDEAARVDRNNVADFIAPALNNAFYHEYLLSNPDNLAKCFVTTESRAKFDAQLGMHLIDPKPPAVQPAERVRTGRSGSHLEAVVTSSYVQDYAPPVTLLIGPVGAGKSTYLKHFELVSGKDAIDSRNAHWIYVDFEGMGPTGNSRSYLYDSLWNYLSTLLADEGGTYTYATLVEPAYAKEISAFARGHYAKVYKSDRNQFDALIAEYINKDVEKREPYVDKLLARLAESRLCVVVLDNIDLYEDEDLETTVFSEGLAFSKRVNCHVIISIRDKTFIRHRNDSTFDAYELRKLWMDPPPFPAVLSKRLNLSKKILADTTVRVPLPRGKYLLVPNLSDFFEIVQTSVLSGTAGRFIESVADLNIRLGLSLVINFLGSGHIQADRALAKYIEGYTEYDFPFHEVFKGCMLAQWKHYKEERSDCLNVFDSRLGSRSLLLLRLLILRYLLNRAKDETTLEVPVRDCVSKFAVLGASEPQIVRTLRQLEAKALVRSVTAENIDGESTVALSKSGGYYCDWLCKTLPYVEACMHDTMIADEEIWTALAAITRQIDVETSITERMKMRRKRALSFVSYLQSMEGEALDRLGNPPYLSTVGDIQANIESETAFAVRQSTRYYG